MLPSQLHGPGKTIRFESPEAFLSKNRVDFPNLDPDFILQICFEHPDRFNWLFPLFDPILHSAVRITKSVGWIYNNVRYDKDEIPDYWSSQFDELLEGNKTWYFVFNHMLKTGTWPFPPVIIDAKFAEELATHEQVGRPYYLIEGTHRVSYMRRMVQRGMVSREAIVDIIEVLPNPPIDSVNSKT